MTADSPTDVLNRFLPESIREESDFAVWFEPLNALIQVAATEVVEKVRAVLEGESQAIGQEECCHRQIFHLFFGGDLLTKSAKSIRSKVVRSLSGDQGKRYRRRPLSLVQVRNLVLSFSDLGRFRVICGLASDVDRFLSVLLNGERTELCNRFPVDGPVKDYVHDLSRRNPAQGHRARQFAVRVATGVGRDYVLVEVQLMTMVQHAWDQRNHPLYECTREGAVLPDVLTIRDVALAEALYLVDEQASRNWQEFLRWRKGSTSR